jgi:hypothetical protein
MLSCDFCNTDVPTTEAYVVHGEPMALILSGDGVIVEMNSPDDWCACAACFHRLAAHDYTTIARSVTNSLCLPESVAHSLERGLVEMYSRLSILQ